MLMKKIFTSHNKILHQQQFCSQQTPININDTHATKISLEAVI